MGPDTLDEWCHPDNHFCPQEARAPWLTASTFRLWQGVSVLVMDNEPMVRTGIRRQLVAGGAQVADVSCGEELLAADAAARARGEPPVCIVDMHIAEVMAVMAVLRECWPDVHAIACTGHAEVQSTAMFGELGFSDWLLKPYEAERLRQVVHRLAFRPGSGAR